MNTKPGIVRRGPNGVVTSGDFIPVRKNGPYTWGHNGDGVVNIMEVDAAKMKEGFRQFEKDRLFLEAHREEWLEQYPDMYVAVYLEKLVGAAATPDELVAQLKAKGVHPGDSYWQFMDSDPMDLAVPG